MLIHPVMYHAYSGRDQYQVQSYPKTIDRNEGRME